MSSPISPTQGPSGPSSSIPATSAARADAPSFDAELAVHDTRFGSPPPAVMAQVAAAGALAERLLAGGRQLRFATGADGATAIELHDLRTGAVTSMPVADAFALAGDG